MSPFHSNYLAKKAKEKPFVRLSFSKIVQKLHLKKKKKKRKLESFTMCPAKKKKNLLLFFKPTYKNVKYSNGLDGECAL